MHSFQFASLLHEPVHVAFRSCAADRTRELAFQIKNEYTRFAKYMPDVRVSTFFGGAPVVKDADTLRDETVSTSQLTSERVH